MISLKKELKYYFLAILFIIFIYIIRFIERYVNVSINQMLSFLINIIIISLISWWGVSINNRITSTYIKKLLLLIVILFIFWEMIKLIKYKSLCNSITIERYLWYLYYLPQTLTPLLFFYVALYIGKQENEKINKWWYLMLIPAIAFVLLVLTNDYHGLVFTFYNGIENFSKDYSYQFVFYLIMIWMFSLILISFIILMFKCEISVCRRNAWIPLSLFLIMITLTILSFMGISKSLSIIETHILTFISLYEGCILIGLIPSNRNYQLFFKESNIAARIMDKTPKVIYSSKNYSLDSINDNENSIINNKRIRRKNIHGGYIYWYEDITKIQNLMNELIEANDKLLEEKELIIAENNIHEKEALLKERNQLYNEIYSIIKPQMNKLSEIINNISINDPDFKKAIGKAGVIGAYIKRRSNLEIIKKDRETSSISELVYAINESIIYLNLIDISASINQIGNGNFNIKLIILLYEWFEKLIELGLESLTAILINIITNDNELIIKVAASDLWANITKDQLATISHDFEINVENQDDTTYILKKQQEVNNMRFIDLPVSIQSVVLILLFIILVINIVISLIVIIRKIKKLLFFSITIITGLFFFLWWVYVGWLTINEGIEVPIQIAMANTPGYLVITMLILFFISTIILIIYSLSYIKNNLSKQSIKEGLDMLPTGLCYATLDGLVLLVNKKMNDICKKITGSFLMNANIFWNKVIDNSINQLFVEVDNQIFSFQKNGLIIEGKVINEIIAFDVTEEFNYKKELDTKNEQIKGINARLRNYSHEIDKITKENEILNAKIKIHDDLGELLIMLKYVIEYNDNYKMRNDLLNSWKNNNFLMQRSNVENSINFIDIYNLANTLKIELKIIGKSIYEQNLEEIMLLGVKECLTNLVSHSKGKKLIVNISLLNNTYLVTYENDGDSPQEPIEMGGGLSNLKNIVERINGKFEIIYEPEFIIKLLLPKEKKNE